MAIDNAEKRKSVAGIPFHIFLGVTNNASKDQEWRQQAAWGYSGIAADAPSADEGNELSDHLYIGTALRI